MKESKYVRREPFIGLPHEIASYLSSNNPIPSHASQNLAHLPPCANSCPSLFWTRLYRLPLPTVTYNRCVTHPILDRVTSPSFNAFPEGSDARKRARASNSPSTCLHASSHLLLPTGPGSICLRGTPFLSLKYESALASWMCASKMGRLVKRTRVGMIVLER